MDRTVHGKISAFAGYTLLVYRFLPLGQEVTVLGSPIEPELDCVQSNMSPLSDTNTSLCSNFKGQSESLALDAAPRRAPYLLHHQVELLG